MDPNREKLILETLRQSEKLLDAQLQIAVAADSRAMTFCGLTIAAASLLVGLADRTSFPLPMYIAALLLFIAAVLAGLSARPVNWHAPGQKAADFDDDIEAARTLIEVAADMCSHNDEYITHNANILRLNGRLLWSAYLAVVASAPISALALLWP